MPKIERKAAKLFASGANAGAGGVAQFGSLAAGSPVYSKDPDVIQSLSQYTDGWGAACLGTKSPALEDRNALDYITSYQLQYILQQGVPEWLSTETYFTNNYVVGSDGILYRSVVNDNTNHDPVSDTAHSYWIGVFADVNLSNLTTTGNNLGNWSSNVTNCIIKIPRRVNITLSSGTLTLKSGSKVYVPNGEGTFNETTIASDITATEVNNNKYMVFTNGTSINKRPISACFSGSSAPTLTGVTYAAWYDTSNNVVKLTSDSGSTWTSGYCLPFCIITVSDGAITSIDDIFNGFGYIGSTVFALPGVKGLVPNGFEADGSVKSTIIETNGVKTQNTGYNNSSETYSVSSGYITISKNYVVQSEQPTSISTLWYDPVDNRMRRVANDGTIGFNNTCVFGTTFRDSSGKITSFKQFGVVRITDDNALPLSAANLSLSNLNSAGVDFINSLIQAEVKKMLGRMDYSNGVEITLERNSYTYTVPSDGYVIIRADALGGHYLTINSVAVTFPSNMARNSDSSWLPVSKDDIVAIDSNPASSSGDKIYLTFVPQKP